MSPLHQLTARSQTVKTKILHNQPDRVRASSELIELNPQKIHVQDRIKV